MIKKITLSLLSVVVVASTFAQNDAYPTPAYQKDNQNKNFVTVGSAVFTAFVANEIRKSIKKHKAKKEALRLQITPLYGGKYDEIHIKKRYQKVGRVLIDTKTRKIAAFTHYDSLQITPEVLSRSWSIDPLASKYPQWSPYAAFADNPILFVDPDGREIAIKDPNTGKVSIFKPGDPIPGGASQFVKGVYASLNHLVTNGGTASADLIGDLVNDDGYTVTITENTNFGKGETSYSPKQGIAFNPYEGLIVGGENDGNNKQSPSLGLVHELDHANQHRGLLNDLETAKTGGNKDDIKAAKAAITNFWFEGAAAEEERVVSGVEKSTAKSLKEGFRSNYGDVKGIFKTDSPTSTNSGKTSKKEQRQIDKTNKGL